MNLCPLTTETISSAATIPIFPILYKQNNKGKILQWQVSIRRDVGGQEGQSPEHSSEAYHIVVQFGEQGGQIQTHTTIITKGKSNRSILEQTILEATSKFHEKKHRDTYREDMEIHSTRNIIRPMLAQTFDPSLYQKQTRAYRLSFPAFVQPKLDGIRCLVCLDEKESVHLQTRNGVEIQLFEALKKEVYTVLYGNGQQYSSIYFDGELYTHQLSFETINGLVRQTKQLNNNAYHDLVEYHIYDFYDPTHPMMTYQERKDILETISTRYFHKIRIVQTEMVHSVEEIKHLHDTYIQQEYEGIMIRERNGIYEINKRSKYLQKYKEFMEEEFTIIGYTQGIGIDHGLIIFKCETSDGKAFFVKPRGSHEYRRQLYEKGADFIGHFLTVIFQEYSVEGIPRFPVGKAIRID